MKTLSVVILSVVAASGAFAQQPPAVMTDVNPPAAEERGSVGAVVLENSMVRAQRAIYEARNGGVRVEVAERNVDRAARAAHAREDMKRAREEDAVNLHEMGAGSLNPR